MPGGARVPPGIKEAAATCEAEGPGGLGGPPGLTRIRGVWFRFRNELTVRPVAPRLPAFNNQILSACGEPLGLLDIDPKSPFAFFRLREEAFGRLLVAHPLNPTQED